MTSECLLEGGTSQENLEAYHFPLSQATKTSLYFGQYHHLVDMNLSVPRVPQRRKRAQRNYKTGDLQKRNLNATPYNDILETRSVRCFLCVCVPTWKYEVHKEMIYGVTYTKPKHQHFWEELKPHLCSCVWKEAKSLHRWSRNLFPEEPFVIIYSLSWCYKLVEHKRRYLEECFCYFCQWASKRLNSKKDINVSWNWSILYVKSSELAQYLCLTN